MSFFQRISIRDLGAPLAWKDNRAAITKATTDDVTKNDLNRIVPPD